MKIDLKKIKYWLQKFDGVWSIPAAFLLFWLVGTIITGIWGYTIGTYDLGFVQPLFLAICIVVGATNAAVLGLYFTVRGVHRYLYGQKKREGDGRINYSKIDWTQVKPLHRLLLSLFVLLYFITAIIFVYLHFV